MIYDACHQRGKQDRTWKLQKVSFHRNSTYDAVMQRCREVTWPSEENGALYYVADGSGISIQRENFEIVSEDGKKNVIAWTLANYLEISHIKYPSRTRLYCVKVSKGVYAHSTSTYNGHLHKMVLTNMHLFRRC